MGNLLDDIKKQVFNLRPALKDIFELHGKETLNYYVSKSWRVQEGAADKVFLDVFLRTTAEIHGSELAQAAANQLIKKPLVSTIDHLGICSHPFFVNSDVIYSLAFEKEEFGIILATESVSLNNTSSRSASLLYHEGAELRHNSFLPDKLKNLPVFSAPRIGLKDIGRFNQATNRRFEGLIDGLEFIKPSESGLSGQAAQISSKFWQKVFPSAPKMLYLPLETIISGYLIKVLENPGDFFYHLVTAKGGRKLWQKYFADEHTFMFWGIGENGKRHELKSLPENVNEFLELIRNRKIYPSSPLCFMALLKAGITCAGGFTQTTWLTNVKEKMLDMLSEAGQADVENLTTTNFAESSLAWFKSGNSYVSPSMTDLFLAKEDYYPKYRKMSENITLSQSIELAMPDIYRVVVPKTEQMTENDMEKVEKSRLTAISKLI